MTIDALTAEQVAPALGCEIDTLNELAARRRVPAVKFGRSWRFPAAAMNQYLVELALRHVERPDGSGTPTRKATPTVILVPKPAKQKIKLPDLTRAVRVG
ncbi:helix-turn-helix domain-containing protein [Aquabacterium sp. A7-Y]|uniref:helix-turn-helix domain-containing protein n=1 Tax=Aquabacterium sp. A7-Y TaxID=1349605 RepID=UPI00223E2D15|nr:helix-turn-helix domain-containing protein [Aquabacterium sp. A7-Y]MCW7541468.1 helix-turn-helix domain-containing protein [Aquabacterium sp. A7-Y]